MEKLVTRAYNRFEIDETKGIITKISSTQRLEDEIGYYTNLKTHHPQQYIYFPRIIASSQLGATEHWMDLELYSYPNLGNYMFIQNELVDWSIVLNKLKDILAEWSHTYPSSSWSKSYIADAARDMYITKTEREQKAFYDGWKDKIENIFLDQTNSIIINKKEYKPFETVWPEVKQYIEKHMLSFIPTMIHGDCCFSNILYGHDKQLLRFIDPRGSFGKRGVYGDIRYDVAKLYHSVDGMYEVFINDKFEVSNTNNEHTIRLIEHRSTIEIGQALRAFENTFFPQFNKKEIKIIQGCIFIGMCARHYDSLTRQHAMYLTGIRLLNEALTL